MRVTILGCGTSGGVPRMPLDWGKCDPANPKNRRMRASILVEDTDTRLVVDTSPDFREQMLREKVMILNAVLYTHDHADHTHGIDDLRGFYRYDGDRMPIYADKRTLASLTNKFDYVFKTSRGYPSIAIGHEINGPMEIGGIKVIPFSQIHGGGRSLGFRFGDIAYSTDISDMTDEAYEALRGIKVWIVDALRYEPHPTHSHLDKTLQWIKEVGPDKAYLTHMTWDMDYATLVKNLPNGVEPAFDGLKIEV